MSEPLLRTSCFLREMGSSKQEKKVKNRSRVPVEIDEVARGVDNGDTNSSAKMNNEVVAKANEKPSKSKKARKNKSNDIPLSSVPSIAVNDADDSLITEKKRSKKEKSPKKVKEFAKSDAYKSKKARKNSSRDNPSSVVLCIENDTNDSFREEKRKSKELQEVKSTDVYQISSGDEDDSKGMTKWIMEFHERRPGIKVLQDRIDEFITAHEEQEEEQRREREAKLNEDGWTVVVHRKGGKRTTDPESGVAVGSVAEAAVREKNAKKKNKDVGVDFYRFQRKEAHRSEVMKLQSKFEEDKKRIQQIRAARKFKPY